MREVLLRVDDKLGKDMPDFGNMPGVDVIRVKDLGTPLVQTFQVFLLQGTPLDAGQVLATLVDSLTARVIGVKEVKP